MPLQGNVHQGLHGEGFVYALACAGGFTTSRMNLDVDGVDWQIAYPGPRGTTRSPKIEVQVKTWANPTLEDGVYKYRLIAKHYNFLAGPGFQIPRFLTLVIVPEDATEYATCSNENMTLGIAGYWLSLADRELMTVGDGLPASTVVDVPRDNLLTVDSLNALLSGDSEGVAE